MRAGTSLIRTSGSNRSPTVANFDNILKILNALDLELAQVLHDHASRRVLENRQATFCLILDKQVLHVLVVNFQKTDADHRFHFIVMPRIFEKRLYRQIRDACLGKPPV